MFDAIIASLIDYVQKLGGIGVLLGVLLETFIVPIPSPLIPAAAGFILVPRDVTYLEAIITSFFTIAIFGSFGATVGSFFGYAIGYFGGRPIIQKYGRYFGVLWNDIERLEKKLGSDNIKEVALFLTRAIPVIPLSPVSFFAGFIHFNLLRFAFFTFLGCLPRYLVLGFVGWWVGVAYLKFAERIGFLEDFIIIISIVTVAIYLIYQIKKNTSKHKAEE